MRFLFTLNMPSFKGSLVHQVIADYDVDSEEAMKVVLEDNAFIVVDQFYNMNDKGGDEQDWQYRGKLILGTGIIGKAQQHLDAPPKMFGREVKRR